MCNRQRGYVPPKIYIFPRSEETLFIYNQTSYNAPRYVYYNNSGLELYEDEVINNTAIPEISKPLGEKTTKLKNIDSRIYIDLWKESMFDVSIYRHKFETIRKITICFLKKENNNVCHLYREEPVFQYPINQYQMELTVDPKNSDREVYLDFNRATGHSSTETSPLSKLIIPVNEMTSNYLIECTLRIKSQQSKMETSVNGEEKEIGINAQLVHRNGDVIKNVGSKSILKMTLCRCPQPPDNADADPFEYLRKNGKNRDLFIMPRMLPEEKHKPYIKKLQLYSNQVLARHKKMTQKEPSEPIQDNKFDFVNEDGLYTRQLGINYRMSVDVFRGTKKSTPPPMSNFFSNIKYDLFSFGQNRGLVKFMASNYAVDEKTVQGIVIDRDFIYGQNEEQTKIENIQGIKNIYEKVVLVFREQIIVEAERYVNFPHPWRRPKNKPNLGDNANGTKLSTEIDVSLNGLLEQDSDAITGYGASNGVPYFYGGKSKYNDFVNAYSTLMANWDAYPNGKKPCGEFGLDCSGLIINCLRDVKVGFQEQNAYTENAFVITASYEENANSIRNTRMRRLPETKNSDGNTLIQSGDLIATSVHIALCAENNEYVTQTQKASRYFTIIHNYGEDIVHINAEPSAKKGFFGKTLCGPFRHWGVRFVSDNGQAVAGRVYLWY